MDNATFIIADKLMYYFIIIVRKKAAMNTNSTSRYQVLKIRLQRLDLSILLHETIINNIAIMKLVNILFRKQLSRIIQQYLTYSS